VESCRRWTAAKVSTVCLAVLSASTINRASDTGLFRSTEPPGLWFQTCCAALLPTAVIDTITIYDIRVPNVVEVCLIVSRTVLLQFTSDAAFVQGAWSREEESQLLCVIEELAKAGKTDMSVRGFWVSVSKAFGGTRTPKQCRNKWCVIASTHLMLYRHSSAGLIRSKAKSEMKTRHAGVRQTAIFWFASTCCMHTSDCCPG
jgi:hypothetical protein